MTSPRESRVKTKVKVKTTAEVSLPGYGLTLGGLRDLVNALTGWDDASTVELRADADQRGETIHHTAIVTRSES